MHPRAVCSRPSAADQSAEDEEDINCETSSLFLLAMCDKRQQELPGVARLVSCGGRCRWRGRCRCRSASAKEHHGSTMHPGMQRWSRRGLCEGRGWPPSIRLVLAPAWHRPGVSFCPQLQLMQPARGLGGSWGGCQALAAATGSFRAWKRNGCGVSFLPGMRAFALSQRLAERQAPKTKLFGL